MRLLRFLVNMSAPFLTTASSFIHYTLELHNCAINFKDVKMHTFKSNFLREIIHISLLFTVIGIHGPLVYRFKYCQGWPVSGPYIIKMD